MRQRVRGCPEPGRVADDHSGSVRRCPRQDRCCSGTAAEVTIPAGHQPCAPCVDASVTCDSSVPGHHVRAASHKLPCPRPANRKDHHVSTLAAGVREAPDTVRAADCHGHQPGYVCRIPAVRTAEAADGQSADRSGSLRLSLHPQGRPCGRPPQVAALAPAATRRPPGPAPPSAPGALMAATPEARARTGRGHGPRCPRRRRASARGGPGSR
jgi:hypothetical protein